MISFFIVFSMKVVYSLQLSYWYILYLQRNNLHMVFTWDQVHVWWFDIHTLCRVITRIKINTNPPPHIVDIDSALFSRWECLQIYSNQLSSIQYHVSCNHHTVPLLFRTSSSCKWKMCASCPVSCGVPYDLVGKSLCIHSLVPEPGWGLWWQWRAMWVSRASAISKCPALGWNIFPHEIPLQTETGTMNPKEKYLFEFFFRWTAF